MTTVTIPKPSLFMALVMFIIIPAFSPAAFAALEQSSKKECALCHVMWLDVFRTNKETLIKWQPGNVLMKDTQGIVSAEEVCYSCHDGYVADSRTTAWKYNNHTTFKRPSADVTIPDTLPLSNKDEIYCGTCHSPHSGRESVPGDSPEETIPGPLSFLRRSNTDSRLCEACHAKEADYQKTNGHPVHTDKLGIPEKMFALGSAQATKNDMVICETCHKVHGAKGRDLTVLDNSQSALCMMCHQERTIDGTPHDARLTMPDERNAHGQPVSQYGPCSVCHVSHAAAGYKLLDRRIPPGNPASQICLSCHTGRPDSKIKGVGRYSHSIDVAAVIKADRRGAPAPLADRLPFFSAEGIRQPAGTIQCFTCHDIHRWDPTTPDNRGGKNADGNAANSFLRIAASQSSALCVECHHDKRQLLRFDHNLVITAPEAKNSRGDTAGVSGPCGACHIPHDAADKILWARGDEPAGQDGMPLYCTGCHAAAGAAGIKQVGKNDHPVDASLQGRNIPPPAQVGAILPLYNAAGGTEGGDRIMCRTCHDPHNWRPADGSPGPADPTGVAAQASVQDMEGDARTSFLRKAASPTPDLCVVCHADTALLVGTDHDLFVTKPTAKNLLDQTVTESGQCGVCHAAHNGPHPRLAWAQALGPVEDNQHPMNALCTGCHSTGGPAAAKVPAVATHPEGKLINNILTFDHQTTGYIKIYDPQWKEVNVGDLSCSSCHSFYRWDHRSATPGPGINLEGDADTSFLRTSSEKTVCIECHGQTAIWQYTYYHSREKRAMLKNKPLSPESDDAP